MMSKEPLILLVRNAAAFDFGGGERLPVFIARGLNKEGYRTLLVSRSKKLLDFARQNDVAHQTGWWWARQNWSGWRVVLTPIYILWQLALTAWYLQLFIRLRPAVAHLQSKDDFIAGTLAARLCGVRVVWSDYADLKHIWKNLRVWYKNPVGKLVYWCGFLAHEITVVSEADKELVAENLSQHSKMRKKLTVVYVGALDKAVEPIERANKKVIFCAASRIVTDKGIGELLTAFTRLQESRKDVELWILGDGPEREKFEVEQPGVTFFGHVLNPLDSIGAADVFVLPTYHEGFSNALVEASMLARAIIATRVGGNVEIIEDGKTGLLVNVRDSDDLLKAMERLVDDTSLREKLGKNARKQYEKRFTFDVMLKSRLIPLYEKNSH